MTTQDTRQWRISQGVCLPSVVSTFVRCSLIFCKARVVLYVTRTFRMSSTRAWDLVPWVGARVSACIAIHLPMIGFFWLGLYRRSEKMIRVALSGLTIYDLPHCINIFLQRQITGRLHSSCQVSCLRGNRTIKTEDILDVSFN